jgi:hypothetical protein
VGFRKERAVAKRHFNGTRPLFGDEPECVHEVAGHYRLEGMPKAFPLTLGALSSVVFRSTKLLIQHKR